MAALTGPPERREGRAKACLRRALGTDHSALCRRTDRLRARLLLVVLLFLVLAPLPALLAGELSYHHGLSEAAAQAAQRHPATAVTQARAVRAHAEVGHELAVPASARWNYPPGRERTGYVLVAPGTPAGTQLRIWVDNAGQPTLPPRSTADVAADAWVCAVGSLAGILTFTLTGAGIARRALDRRDSDAWARGWAEVEPDWSGRRPHGIDGR